MKEEQIGKTIYRLRTENHLTQQELANKLNVTSQAVSKWENNRGLPDIAILTAISNLFNVDLDTLIKGESSRTIHHIPKIYYIIPLLLIILLSIFLIYKITHPKDFTFKTIASNNTNFNIKGVAAYSEDKKSIYISDIDYVNDSTELYTSLDCTLYESNTETDKKIGSSATSSKEPSSLNELLKNIEFNVDNYSSTCKNLTTANLFLTITATDTSNNYITYKIPLELNDQCITK